MMISDFLVMHPSGPFFQLDNNEYEEAIKAHPELAIETDVNYIERTASGCLEVGGDAYFTNSTVLEQFERLLKMIKFKKKFKDHAVEIIVDNARTHTARPYSIHDFGKSIGTRCPVDKLHFVDEKGVECSLETHFTSGAQKGQSKGLLQIAKELNVPVQPKIKLNELRTILGQHAAFKTVSIDK